jgi:hypothetical protein
MESSATVWAGVGGRIANNGPLGGSVQRVNDDIVELFADGVLEKVKKERGATFEYAEKCEL